MRWWPSSWCWRPERVWPNNRQPSGNGDVKVTGELKQWHKVTLTLDGPFAHERDRPESVHRLRVHGDVHPRVGRAALPVPGISPPMATRPTLRRSGNAWRAHLAPDKPGRWDYSSLREGRRAPTRAVGGDPAVAPFDGRTGRSTSRRPTRPADFRGQGRLDYVGRHHLRFAGTGEYFLKAGPMRRRPSSPTRLRRHRRPEAGRAAAPLGAAPADWKPGDPTWQGGKGKGLIGALNYLAGKGLNAFSFLTYNRGGDGDNVWPFVEPDDKFHYDCSKLDQWGVVFDHAHGARASTCISSSRRTRSTTTGAGARRGDRRRAGVARWRRRSGPSASSTAAS